MKRYLPFLLVIAAGVGALWYFWPDVLSARKKRQDDLDTALAAANKAAEDKLIADAKAAADAKTAADAAALKT